MKETKGPNQSNTNNARHACMHACMHTCRNGKVRGPKLSMAALKESAASIALALKSAMASSVMPWPRVDKSSSILVLYVLALKSWPQKLKMVLATREDSISLVMFGATADHSPSASSTACKSTWGTSMASKDLWLCSQVVGFTPLRFSLRKFWERVLSMMGLKTCRNE